MEVYCIVNRSIKLSEPTKKIVLQEPLAYDNALAHAMQVTVFNDDGTEADLVGVGVTASFLKADNNTVTPINGEIVENENGVLNIARVLLPPSCYVTPGRYKFTMNLSKSGGYNRTALWVEGKVERNVSGDIIDPGTPVGNIPQAIGNANAAAASANNAATAATTAAASANAAAQAATEAADASIRYDQAQSLTDAQKTQARANASAASASDVATLQEDVTDLKSAVIDNEKNATGALTGLKSQFEGAIKSNILLNLSTLTKTVKTTERYVHNDFVLGAEPNTKYCFSFGTIDNKLSNVLAVAIFQDANGTQLSSTNINASYGEITSPEGAVKLLFQVYFVLNVYPSATTEITYHDIIVTKDTGTQTFMLNGTHPDLTAGTASQILSKTTVEDQVPYTFRKTGGGQSVGDRATLDKIVGGTVAWNQLGKLNPSSSTSNGITWTPTDDGIVANGTATADSTYGGITQQDLVSGHVYAVFGCPANGSMSTYRILVSNSAATGNPGEFGNGIMFRAKTGASSYLSGLVLCVTSGATVNSIKFKPQLFDLTKMFGATIADYIYSLETATAGAGVAWFRQLFPLDYYDYNPGELISVSGVSARETVGFNAWDEVSETGAIDITTGANVANNDVSRSKNYIPLLANATYCYTNKNSSSGIRACFYDSSKNYIGYLSNNNPVPQTFVVPSNAAYMRFYASNVSAICINLSDSSRNGEYEPYEKHSYSLDSSLTLRGIPKLDAQNRLYWDGDEYTPDGKVARRYDTVIMDGTENWVKYRDAEPNTGYYSYYCNPFGNKLPHESWNTDYCFRLTESDYNPKGNNGNDVYNQTGINSAIDRTGNFMVCAKGISTVADFKAWVASVHLGIVYLLKESTTETAAEYQDIQIVDPYGTESFVTDGIVPVGHVTQYHENLREKIEQLPADFSTLIAPVEKTFVATRPYTSGALLIVNNVLYKATASIANGATITPGTNCTPTTLAAIIAALQ